MKSPAFSFYPNDFMSSLAVKTMNSAQRGGYMMLLCAAWQYDKPGFLPSDDDTLWILSGMTQEEWEKGSKKILTKFPLTEDGSERYNPRMLIEAGKQASRREKLAANGAKGGKAKANNNQPIARQESGNSLAIATENLAIAKQMLSLTSSSSITEQVSSEGECEREVAAIAAPPLSEEILKCTTAAELLALWHGLPIPPETGSVEQLAFRKRMDEIQPTKPPKSEVVKKKPAPKGSPLDLPLPYPSPAFKKEWEMLMECPKHSKKPLTAHKKILEQLAELNCEVVAISAISDAIAGNYQGVVFDRHKDQARKLSNGGMAVINSHLAVPQHPDAYRYDVKPELAEQRAREEQERRDRITQERIKKWEEEEQQRLQQTA